MAANLNDQPITLIADPRVIAIAVHENDESLIDIKDATEIAIGPSPETPNNTDYTKMRKTVYQKLLQAQSLLPAGIKFCLYEAYRSLSLQKMLFDARYALNQKNHPNWSDTEIFLESTKLVSPVINLDNSINVPPHSTGGAIDVYLVDVDGKALEMGIHPKDWMTDIDASYSLTLSTQISAAATQNRKIMSDVLAAVGFINYPTEYWHWSYVDRYWAYHVGSDRAIYGSFPDAQS